MKMPALVSLTVFVMLGVSQVSAATYHHNNVFKDTQDVPRVYSAYFMLTGCDTYTLETQGLSAGGDPVMFLQDTNGTQIDMDDDSGPGLNSRIRYKNPDCPEQSSSGIASSVVSSVAVGVPAAREVMLDPVRGTVGSVGPELGPQIFEYYFKVVRVLVLSYDAEYQGTTDVVLKKGNTESVRIPSVAFGSKTLFAKWEAGDVVRTTGAYFGMTLHEACSRIIEEPGVINTIYNRDSKECTLGVPAPAGSPEKWVAGPVLGGAAICTRYSNLPSVTRPLAYRGVTDHGHRCEAASTIHDTVMIAMEEWTKRPIASVQRVCRWRYDWRSRRYRRVCYNGVVYNTRELDIAQTDDDSAAAGTWSQLEMEDTNQGSYAAVIVGLHPWNETFHEDTKTAQRYGTGIAASAPVNIYRDRIQTTVVGKGYQPYLDSDQDGLSQTMEGLLGTSDTNADSDADGLIDSLETYGGAGLPLPVFGATPTRKTIVVEFDRLQGVGYGANFDISIESAGHAFEEADWELITFSGQPNGINLVVNQNPQMAAAALANAGTCGASWQVGEPADLEALSTLAAQNAMANPDFDLRDYIFVRRYAFTDNAHTHGCAGAARDINNRWTGYGRFAVGRWVGVTFTHELGHLMGLRHGGGDADDHPLENDVVGLANDGDNRQHKPNRWSVMAYNPRFNVPGEGPILMLNQSSDWAQSPAGHVDAPAYFADVQLNELRENALDETVGVTFPAGNNVNSPYVYENVRRRGIGTGFDSGGFADHVAGQMNWNNDFLAGVPVLEPVDLANGQPGAQANIDQNCTQGWVNVAGIPTLLWTDAFTGRQAPQQLDACAVDTLDSYDDVNHLQNLDLSDWSTAPGMQQSQMAQMNATQIIPFHLTLPVNTVIPTWTFESTDCLE